MNSLVKVSLVCLFFTILAVVSIAVLMLIQHFAMLGALTYEFSQISSDSKNSFLGLCGYIFTIIGIQYIGYSVVTLSKDTVDEISYRIRRSLDQNGLLK